jgi:dnd system-associated protein 4
MELLKKIKDRAPEYDATHEDLITKFTLVQGGRAGTAGEVAAWEQGKYFSTKYEIYMYAALLGLKNDYRIPIRTNVKKEKFIEIKYWQPADLADYVIMCVFAKSDIDLNGLENIDDKDVEKEILNLRKLMEEYANGGFDKIRSKLEQEPTFFDNNDNCFIDLLEETCKQV